MNNNTDPNEMLNSKISIPTSGGVPFVSQNSNIETTDYEYLRFSLRITEDIIRNNLYNPKDMERVFNSHIEANRDRLEMKKMLEQIQQLQDEINIKKMLGECKNAEYPNVNLLNHIIHRNEITAEQMQQMTEDELQYVITGILNPEQLDMCSLCMRENAGCFKKETERRQRNVSTINEFMASKQQSSQAKGASEMYNEYINESDPTSSATDEYDYRKPEIRADQSIKRFVEMVPSPATEKSKSFSSTSDGSSRIEEEIEYQELSRIEEDHFKTKSNIESVRELIGENVRINKEICDKKELQIPTFPQSVSKNKILVKTQSNREAMQTFPQSYSSASRSKGLAKTQSDRDTIQTFPQTNSSASRTKGLAKTESDRENIQTISQINSNASISKGLVEKESYREKSQTFPQTNSNASRTKGLAKTESDGENIQTFPQTNSNASRTKGLVEKESYREKSQTFPQTNSSASRECELAEKESNRKEMQTFPQSISSPPKTERLAKKEKQTFPQCQSAVSWAKGLCVLESDIEVQKLPQSTSSSSRCNLSKEECKKKEIDRDFNFSTKNLVNIASETADPVLTMHSDTQTVLERYIIEKPSPMRENSRGSVDKNIQTTVRPQMPSQYSLKNQYSNISNSVNAFVENINNAVAKKISDLYKPAPSHAKMYKNKANVLYKTGKESSVLSRLNVEELPPPIIIPPRPDKNEGKGTSRVLKQLQKYETNSESSARRTSITSYELSIFTDQCETYIPKFHRRKFFPDISTQTSLQWTPPAESSLSDGEVKNCTSESDDTKTDVT